MKAIDDKTLEVTLNFSSPWFVRTLSHATLFPAPVTVIEAKGIDWTKPENIVGNGAYTLTENTPANASWPSATRTTGITSTPLSKKFSG